MLKIVIGVVVLMVVSLIGARKTFQRLKLPLGARYIYLTGMEFIFVGLLLGTPLWELLARLGTELAIAPDLAPKLAGLGILDDSTLLSLAPLFSLALGFVGLIFGLQLETDKLRRLPRRYLALTLVQAGLTMAVVFGPAYLLLRHYAGGSSSGVILGAFVLAAIAGNTGQSTFAVLVRELRMRGSDFLDLLRYMSGLDAVLGLTALGIAFSFLHDKSPVGLGVAVGGQWILLSILLGVGMGLLLHLLTRFHCSEEELLVFAIGMIVLSSGIALYLRLSPLFINMVMGITVANVPSVKDRIFALLARLEKPFYIVLLILAGASWRMESFKMVAVFTTAYIGARFVGKLAGGYVSAKLAPPKLRAPRTMGLSMLSQGGIAIPMVLDYTYLHAWGEVGGAVVTAVLVGVIITGLFSPPLIQRVLQRHGGVKP